MTTTLRAVLNAFEAAEGVCSLQQVAAHVGAEPALVEQMIMYWVRKGRVQAVTGAQACPTCGTRTGCPFIVAMPEGYQLIDDEVSPSCGG